VTRWSFLREAQPEGGEPDAPASIGATLTAPSSADWRVTTTVHEGDRITDLKLRGFRTAGSCSASPEVLKTVIGWIYHNKVTVDDANAENEKARLEQLAHQIATTEGQVTQSRHHCGEIEESIKEARTKLEEKRAELVAVRAGDSTVIEAQGLSDRTSFYIASGILFFLTLYLFLFYVSAIYNAFIFDAASATEEGLRTGRELSVTIFNGLAFQKAWSAGLMTFLFLGSAPSIVMGLGYLVHHFLRQGKKLLIFLIIGVTLLFDLLLAYEIVYQIHRIKILTGETDIPFSIRFLAAQPEFYIILLAGFVVYLIWGGILGVVLEGVEKFRPARVAARKVSHAISAIEGKLERLQGELREAQRGTVKLESELKILENKRSPRELSNNAFRRHTEEMMQGWLTYIAQAFPRERDEREAEAQEVREKTISLLTQ
jgi:hypothetical protein